MAANGANGLKTGMTVIQLKSGITVETIESDEDYRTGTITKIVVSRVRIAWWGTDGANVENDYIYVNADELVKLDNSNVCYPIPLNR